jgi:hypothetical protein
MGPVTATGRVIDPGLRQRPSDTPAGPPAEKEAGRALVPVVPGSAAREPHNVHQLPSAPFLAQLIAASRKLPQAREKRRAEPHEAIAAYKAVARAA